MPGPNIANQVCGLGARIKMTRQAVKMTQDVLAHQAKISTQLVSMLERGEVLDPHISCLVALARTLGVSTDYLVGLAGEAHVNT